MSKVILYIALSLDGFIAREDGDIAWLQAFEQNDEDYGFADFRRTVGACIMGSRTYEKALTLEGAIEKDLPTYVATNRELPTVPGAGVIFHAGGLKELAQRAGEHTDKDIWLVGGGQLAGGFLNEGLIDEMILSFIPVVLGAGLPLFGTTKQETRYRLVTVTTYDNGIVQTRYATMPLDDSPRNH